jgi:hypothetical protein
MVKIEKLLDGGRVTVTRGGAEVTLFEGQLIPEYELGTLKVLAGRVIYSVNEQEVVERVAEIEQVVAKPAAKKPLIKQPAPKAE